MVAARTRSGAQRNDLRRRRDENPEQVTRPLPGEEQGMTPNFRPVVPACAALFACLAAAQAPALPEAPVVTEHEIRVDGDRLAYTAEAGRVAIRDVGTGEPRGHIFYVAYRVPSDRPRPLTFVWNGGPGAPAALLHFEIAGPKRLDGGRLVDNADTWLTATDLVFVDPVGTGFSRPTRAEYADEFYGTLGDVASVTEFVRAWRLLHGALDNPVFLAGESWGAGRAANVGYELLERDIPVAGLVLISGGAGLEVPGEVRPLVAALRAAHLAATGLWHGRTAPELGRDPETLTANAARWVRETYAPALARLDQLPLRERNRIAEELARYTGVPAARIDRNTLELPPRLFRETLLADEEKTLGLFDMRATGEAEPRSAEPILRYLRYELGFRTALPYVGLEELTDGYAPGGEYPEEVNARWNYATGPVTEEEAKAAIAEAVRTGAGPPKLGPPLPGTVEAVGLAPDLRVLVAQGMYDSLANCPGSEAFEEHLPGDVQRAIEFRCYAGGHMMYRDPDTRTRFSRDVRDFVRR
jgi:carboxypeptidase C (cathepsin A)